MLAFRTIQPIAPVVPQGKARCGDQNPLVQVPEDV
jgi:hypothetical protein